MNHGDLLAEATNSIVLPMTAEGVHTMTYNPNPTTSIVEMGKQLLAASRDGLTEDVSQLLARSAPMTTDWLGTSPLHLASMNGHCSTAEVLMRGGCSGDAKTKVDKTPLHLAATEGHSQMAELLLKSGAEVDSKDMLRMTPLHWSVERGHADCAEVLVRYGADVNFENKFGKCPLELASEHGRSDMYEMLQNAEEIRASMPVAPPPEQPINPLVSDPVTMAATQSIQSELNLLGGEPGLMSPPGAGSSGRQRLLSSSSLLADHFITGASPPPSTDHLASQEEAMKFLEGHGITLLPEDTGPTMMESVISSGRQTLTLTEAGKLALSSSAPTSPVITTSGSPFTISSPPSSAVASSSSAMPVTVASIQAATIKPSSAKVINVTAKPATTMQTTKSIVINTSNPQQQTVKTVVSNNPAANTGAVRKEPRVIRVTPEQFAAIKAGKGTRLTGLGGATATTTAATTSRPVIAKALAPGGIKTLPNQKTIKIVRLNPNGGMASVNSVQTMPKPVILSSSKGPTPVVVATAANTGGGSSSAQAKQQAVMKKLKEIQDRKAALEREQQEIMRQLGT